MESNRKRLVTKCDMDGLACGILLKELDLIDSVIFAHPKDVESGRITIDNGDITAGLPYKESVYLAFDYYPGALSNGGRDNLIVNSNMPSTSRVICSYYNQTFNAGNLRDLLLAVDKGYSADISVDEILYPTGWILLSYLIDQRTGLERYGKFQITNTQLIENLITKSKEQTIWDILDSPAVEERLNLYFSCMERCKDQLLRCSTVHYNLVVTDMRNEKIVYPGNRFLIYALFPECNISMNIADDLVFNRTTFVVGKSVIDRAYQRDIGKILRAHGGGGHSSAGTCMMDRDSADELKEKLIEELSYSTMENIFNGYFNFYTGTY